MNRKQQRALISAVIRGNEGMILSKVDRMPEYWQGIELCQFIADTFRDQTAPNFLDKQAYRREVVSRKLGSRYDQR